MSAFFPPIIKTPLSCNFSPWLLHLPLQQRCAAWLQCFFFFPPPVLAAKNATSLCSAGEEEAALLCEAANLHIHKPVACVCLTNRRLFLFGSTVCSSPAFPTLSPDREREKLWKWDLLDSSYSCFSLGMAAISADCKTIPYWTAA